MDESSPASSSAPPSSGAPPPPAPPTPPKPALQRFVEAVRAAPVSALIVLANVIVFAVAESAGSTTQTSTLLRFGATWRRLVWEGESWRLVTSMFLHIGPLHLLMNSWFGFRISAQVERAMGPWRFLLLYFASGIAGSAASVIGHDAVSAGASGALFGLIGWRFVAYRLMLGSWKALFTTPAVRRELLWIGAWFVIGAYAGFDNYAHAGGLALGMMLTWALASRPPERRKVKVAASLAVLAGLVVLAARPLPLIHREDRLLFDARHAAEDDPAAVVQLTEPLVRSAPHRLEALDLRSVALVRLGRGQEALAAVDEVLASAPRHARAWAVRGRARALLGDVAGAEGDYQRAIELDPAMRDLVAWFRAQPSPGSGPTPQPPPPARTPAP